MAEKKYSKTDEIEKYGIERYGIVYCIFQSPLVKEYLKLQGLIDEHIERKDRIYPFIFPDFFNSP